MGLLRGSADILFRDILKYFYFLFLTRRQFADHENKTKKDVENFLKGNAILLFLFKCEINSVLQFSLMLAVGTSTFLAVVITRKIYFSS